METLRTKLIDVMMNQVAATLETERKLQSEIMPYRAIWLEKPLRTSREVKCRITIDDLVKVGNGILVDCDGPPTHKIVGLQGTAYSKNKSIDLENLSTHQIETIYL